MDIYDECIYKKYLYLYHLYTRKEPASASLYALVRVTSAIFGRGEK